MTDNELIDCIAENLPTSGFRRTLAYWFDTNKHFRNFIFLHKNKIRKKVQTANTVEDKNDVFFELEFPYLILLDNRFEVEYEKYGGGKERAPDFTVTFKQHSVFNAEVKRIREGDMGWRYEKCIEQICAETQGIPSTLHVYIDYATRLDFKSDLIDRLESRQDAIIQFIKQIIHTEESKLPISSTGKREYPIPDFENELLVSISKPPRKTNHSETPCSRGFRPLFYTQKEFKKFGDVICDSMRQMRPKESNLLFINSASSTHEQEDLLIAVNSIRELSNKDDDNFFINKGFQGKEDFLHQSIHLSGILFRSTDIGNTEDRNFLWCNDEASFPIAEPIKEYLMRMDRPRSQISWNS